MAASPVPAPRHSHAEPVVPFARPRLDFRIRNWGRCARPLWRREKWCCVRPGRRSYCAAAELVAQAGGGDHRQELTIVAERTRLRRLSPGGPPDGVGGGWWGVWARVRGAVAGAVRRVGYR